MARLAADLANNASAAYIDAAWLGQVAWDGFQGTSSPETMVFPLKWLTRLVDLIQGGKPTEELVKIRVCSTKTRIHPNPWSPGSGSSGNFLSVWGWGDPVIFAHVPIMLADDITIFGFNSQVFGRTSEQILSPDVTHPPNKDELKCVFFFEFIVDYLEKFQASIFFCTLKDLEGSSNFLPGSLKLRWGGGLPKCWRVARWHWMGTTEPWLTSW